MAAIRAVPARITTAGAHEFEGEGARAVVAGNGVFASGSPERHLDVAYDSTDVPRFRPSINPRRNMDVTRLFVAGAAALALAAAPAGVAAADGHVQHNG